MMILAIVDNNIKTKAVDLTLGCTRIHSNNLIQILSLNLCTYLEDLNEIGC